MTAIYIALAVQGVAIIAMALVHFFKWLKRHREIKRAERNKYVRWPQMALQLRILRSRIEALETSGRISMNINRDAMKATAIISGGEPS